MTATALRTSINADLQLLSEEKLKAVSKYVRILVLYKDDEDKDKIKKKGLRHSLDVLRQIVKESGKTAENNGTIKD